MLPEQCAVGHILCHRSDLVKRRAVGNQSVTGYGSVGRLDTGDAAEGAGLTDGTACIGTKCKEHSSAATAAQEPPEEPPGTCSDSRDFRHAESRSLGGASHGKLIHVGLSDDDTPAFSRFITASAV